MEFFQIKRIMGNQIGLPLQKTMICRGMPKWLPFKCEAFLFNDPSTTTTATNSLIHYRFSFWLKELTG